MNHPLRIGLIGAGLMGRKHAIYLMRSADCMLTAIADPAASAESVAVQHGATSYHDVDTMLDREELDAVIIASPNERHEQAGIAAAARRLPMLIEKPIAASLDAAYRLKDAADSADVPLLIGHHRRYNPSAIQARAFVQNGTLGRLVAVNTVWSVRKPDAYFEADWRRQTGGGPMLINLIHEIDLLRYIAGEIVEVMAASSNEIRGFTVEDSAALVLRFESGALGTAILSDCAPSPWTWEQATGENHPTFPENEENPTRFFGTEAALEFPRLKIWRHDGKADWHHPLSAEQVNLPRLDVFDEQIDHFARVIRGEDTPMITGESACRSLAATLAVVEAASANTSVRVIDH